MANSLKCRKQTTQGWQLLYQWRDVSTNWVNLKDIKHSYPVQVAECAFANRIDDEPAFAWWVSQVIKKQIRVVAKLKSKYWQRAHKFGIRIPKTVKQALAFDREW